MSCDIVPGSAQGMRYAEGFRRGLEEVGVVLTVIRGTEVGEEVEGDTTMGTGIGGVVPVGVAR